MTKCLAPFAPFTVMVFFKCCFVRLICKYLILLRLNEWEKVWRFARTCIFYLFTLNMFLFFLISTWECICVYMSFTYFYLVFYFSNGRVVAIKEEELIEAPRVHILPAHADAHVSVNSLTCVIPHAMPSNSHTATTPPETRDIQADVVIKKENEWAFVRIINIFNVVLL